MYGMKKARVLRVEAGRRPVGAKVTDRSPWDWHAQSCSCGLPPEECARIPEPARASPPPGDWRVWGYVGGRGAGKTRAGACWVQHRAEAGITRPGRRRGARLHGLLRPPVAAPPGRPLTEVA